VLWQFLSRNMAVITVFGASIAYIYPPAFLIFKDWFLWFFAATMFALGVVLKPDEARAALSRPSQIGMGVLCQYSIMPLLGFAAASLAVRQGVAPEMALGFIIVGCAPGAMASNVITFHYISEELSESSSSPLAA